MITRKKIDSWLPFLSQSKQGLKVVRWWNKATENQRKQLVRWMNQSGVKDAVQFAECMLFVI